MFRILVDRGYNILKKMSSCKHFYKCSEHCCEKNVGGNFFRLKFVANFVPDEVEITGTLFNGQTCTHKSFYSLYFTPFAVVFIVFKKVQCFVAMETVHQ